MRDRVLLAGIRTIHLESPRRLNFIRNFREDLAHRVRAPHRHARERLLAPESVRDAPRVIPPLFEPIALYIRARIAVALDNCHS